MRFRNAGLRLAVLLWVAVTLSAVRADDPPLTPSDRPQAAANPTYIFLNSPDDLNALLTRLSRPDLVIIDSERFRVLTEAAERGRQAPQTASPTLDALEIDGVLRDAAADLTIRLEVSVADSGKLRLPLPLDGLTVLDVIEEGRESRLERTAAGWELVFASLGRHAVTLKVRAPVRAQAGRRRLELGVPEVASSRLDLVAPGGAADVRIEGEGTVLGITPEAATGRIVARFSPRARLQLSWKPNLAGQMPQAPALTVQGEILLEAQGAQLSAEATFELRVARAPLDFITLKAGAGWEKLRVQVEGVETQAAVSVDQGGAHLLKVAANLIPEKTVRVSLRAQRPLESKSESPVLFTGFSILEAESQLGLIALAHGPELGVRAVARQSVQPLERRADLPASLRMRPTTELGFRFFGQPFELELTWSPAIEWQRVDALDVIHLQSDRTLLDCWMAFHRRPRTGTRLELSIPKRLVIEELGPADVVQSFEIVAGPGEDESTLIVDLDDVAAEASAFAIHVKGSTSALPSESRNIPDVRPWTTRASTRWLAVSAAPNVTFLVEARHASPCDVERVPFATWPDMALASVRGGIVRWFRRGDTHEPELVIETNERHRQVTTRSEIDLEIDREMVGFRQSVDLECRDGSLESIELLIPQILAAGWRVEGIDVERREGLEALDDGFERVRLTPPRPVSGMLHFAITSQFRLSQNGSPAQAVRLAIPQIRVAGSRIQPTRIVATPRGGIELTGGDRWTVTNRRRDESAISDGTLQYVSASDATEPAVIDLRRVPLEPMADLYVPRCYVRSTFLAEGKCRVTVALAVERHGAAIELGVPDDAAIVAAAWSGRSVESIARQAQSRGLKMPLPSGEQRGVLVLTYTTAQGAGVRGWGPTLPPEAIVGSTYWHVVVPSTVAILGQPSGWDDVNAWGWSGVVYQRLGSRWSPERLSHWMQGGLELNPVNLLNESSDAALEGALLFHQPGALALSPLPTLPRGLLVGVASLIAAAGAVSVMGLAARLRFLALASLGLAALAFAAVLTTLARQLAGASAPGLGIGLAMLAINALVARRQRTTRMRGPAGLPVDSQLRRSPAPAQAEEGSTLIRPRGSGAADAAAPSSLVEAPSSTTG